MQFPSTSLRSQPEVVLLVHALKRPPAKPFHVSYWALQYLHSLFPELVQKFEHLGAARAMIDVVN